MEGRRQIIALAGVLLILVACEAQNPPPENHPQWVIHSKVVFREADLTTPREALPQSAFRLTFPYVAGDLYGSPNIGDLIHPVLNSDYTFEIDLNRTQSDLVRSLQPTEFSVDYLKIDPPDARIARLTPLALQADGIEQVATSDWVDTRSNERLMLVYADRPARITGAVTRNGHTVRYNVRIAEAGYVWIGWVETEDEELMFREVDRPENIILALTPPQVANQVQHVQGDSLPAARSTLSDTASASATVSSTDAHSLDGVADLRGVDRPRRSARARGELPDR
jgi:hypothetical protein